MASEITHLLVPINHAGKSETTLTNNAYMSQDILHNYREQ